MNNVHFHFTVSFLNVLLNILFVWGAEVLIITKSSKNSNVMDYFKFLTNVYSIINIYILNNAIFNQHQCIPQGTLFIGKNRIVKYWVVQGNLPERSAASNMLSDLYLYFYHINFINNIIFLCRYFGVIILFSLEVNQLCLMLIIKNLVLPIWIILLIIL